MHMECLESMFLLLELIPEEVQHQYNMHEHVHVGKDYFQIIKGMHRLPQAGQFIRFINHHIYAPQYIPLFPVKPIHHSVIAQEEPPTD